MKTFLGGNAALPHQRVANEILIRENQLVVTEPNNKSLSH